MCKLHMKVTLITCSDSREEKEVVRERLQREEQKVARLSSISQKHFTTTIRHNFTVSLLAAGTMATQQFREVETQTSARDSIVTLTKGLAHMSSSEGNWLREISSAGAKEFTEGCREGSQCVEWYGLRGGLMCHCLWSRGSWVWHANRPQETAG